MDWKKPLTLLCAAILVICSSSVALGVGTLAGTVVPANSEIICSTESQFLAATASVSVTVAQSAGNALQSKGLPASICAGQSYYIPLSVTNTGNGTDTVSLTGASACGWGVSFVCDSNADGVHQSTETTSIADTGALAADAAAACFLCVTVPCTATAGDTIIVSTASAFDPTVVVKTTIALPAPTAPAPPPVQTIPGDFNGDGRVDANDIPYFSQEWARWHKSPLPAFDPAADTPYDLAPRVAGLWPNWRPVGDKAINIQDATAFVECYVHSHNSTLNYNVTMQTTQTATLLIVTLPSAPYGMYQVSIALPSGVQFNPVVDHNGNPARVLRGKKAGNLLFSEYDPATRTIKLAGNVCGHPPYQVASIYLGQ